MKNMYSPAQVCLGTFLGGPIAAVYFLKKNYDMMGIEDSGRTTLIWGTLLTLLFMVGLQYIPDSVPVSAVAAGYSAGVMALVQRDHLRKEDISTLPDYDFRSNWNVLCVAAVSLISFLGLLYFLMLGMATLGLI